MSSSGPRRDNSMKALDICFLFFGISNMVPSYISDFSSRWLMVFVFVGAVLRRIRLSTMHQSSYLLPPLLWVDPPGMSPIDTSGGEHSRVNDEIGRASFTRDIIHG